MKKRILRGGRRFILLSVQHLAAVLAAVCAAVILSNIYFEVNGITDSRSYMLYPWEENGEYEKSPVFNSVFNTSVNDIITMAVIRTQMETEGKFDGKKRVDIAAFVNRKNGSAQTTVSAEYYLEDLIKWSEYGFTYKELTPFYSNSSHIEMEAFKRFRTQQELAKKSSGNTVVISDKEITNAEVTDREAFVFDTPEQKEEITVTIETPSPEEEQITNEEVTNETLMFQREVLEERYKTVDGSSISEYVADWNEYDEFVNTLISASNQLAYNYDTYKKFSGSYDSDQSNLRYCLMIPTTEGYQYFCNVENLPKNVEAMRAEEITAFFRDYGAYLYYYPEHMEYETNTEMSEDEVREALNRYSYVYPEECRIWIAVDTTYPVEDGLQYGKMQYESFTPYYSLWLIGVGAAICVFVVLFIVNTFYEGKREGAEKNEGREEILRLVDHIPAEIMLFLATVIGWLFFVVCVAGHYTFESYTMEERIVFMAVLSWIFSMVFMFFYLSLVRRLRAHAFWKNTIAGWLFVKGICLTRKICGGLKRFADRVYNDKSLVVRTWGPYLFFLAVNLFGLGILFTNFWILGLLGAAAFDLGVGVLQFRMNRTRQQIIDGIQTIREGNITYQVDTTDMYGDNLELANAVNSIGDGIRAAVETSMKDERLKADLITNVSHDIKTPLTSIINYVDLIKREDIQNERVKGYIDILDAKSQRLKQLTEDLVEASKISSGNIVYQFERINFVELIHQTLGEFSEKFEEKNLDIICRLPEEAVPIEADSRRIWRVIENLYNNIYKYALPGTRVYMDMEKCMENGQECVLFSVKNISAQPLNIQADELTERFIRGDVSRSTEGSGLGLSIAKNLTEAQNGSFTIYLDGDLFKVILKFPLYKRKEGA